MQDDQVQVLPKLRAQKSLHWVVAVVAAVVLLAIYYGYSSSLPTDPGSRWDWFWRMFLFELRNNVLGLLMLAPMLYAAITLGWKRALVLMLVLLALITPYILDYTYVAYTAITSYAILVIPVVLVMSIEIKLISDANERAAAEEKKRQREEAVRQLLRAQEDERKRIAQELHDGVAQSLLVTATVAHNLLESGAVSDEYVRAGLDAVKENSLGLVAEVRAICQGLRPSILDNLGLVSAVKWLADNLREETDVDVKLTLSGQVYELEPEESVAVFRVVQEALSNVKKHSRANSVHVALRFSERSMTIDILDDGIGFPGEAHVDLLGMTGKLGLLGMNERAQSIGGRLHIEAGGGIGTCVSISVDRKLEHDLEARTLPHVVPTDAAQRHGEHGTAN